jgi:hypothetical protein
MVGVRKDTSCIPKGIYCYDEKGVCPYWSSLDGLPDQYNGYCSFLDKGDVELAQQMELQNVKTGEVARGDELPFPVSLLWDQCKMCGINDFDDEEEWEDIFGPEE